MANIGTGELTNSIATIVAADALGYLKANTVMSRLVARDWDGDIATHGQVVDIPFTGALSANDKGADTAVTLQTPSDTKVSVTLNKHKEVSFLIEDIGEALSRPNYLQAYLEDGMDVVAEQIDGDIAGLYSGLSQSVAALTGMDKDDFREGRRLLNAAKAPLSNRVFVVSEDAEYDLFGITEFISKDYAGIQGSAGATGLINAYSGSFMGFDVFMDQNITLVAGAPNVYQNLAFHRNAFILATRNLPPAPAGAGVLQRVMSEDGMGLRVTLSYNPDHLGVQTTIDVLYGVAELRDTFGIVFTRNEI